MNLKYLTSLITGVLECILFSGILFGWPSLNYVLQKEGYFSGLCKAQAQENVTTSTPEFFATTLETSLSVASDVSATTANGAMEYFANENVSDGYTASTSNGVVTTPPQAEFPRCDAQSEMLNLVFTIGSTLLSFSTLINGYIYDTFGTWVARVIALLLFTIGCILMAVSSYEMSGLLFPAVAGLAIGGILMLVTNLQIGNLFGKFRSSIITMMSGALDSSSFVFLIFKMLYDAGISLTTIFQVMICLTIFLWLRTYLLLPRRHIPFPIGRGYDYGLTDCGCRNKQPEQRELALVSAPENTNVEEKEALTKEFDHEMKNEKPSTSVLVHLKKSLFWGNVAHFSLLQLRNYFFMGTLIEWIAPMTSGEQELSDYLTVFGTCQLFGVVSAPFNGLLIDAATHFLNKSSKIKKLVPLRAVTYSAIATTILGTLFSVIVAIPSLPLQYLSFVLQVVFRSFLYGGNMSFIAVAFPGEHFGKLYGITMFIGGAVSLLQFPLFALVLRKMGGNFFVINIVFVFVSLLTLAHPLNIYRVCRNKAAKIGKSIVVAQGVNQ